MPRRPRRRAPEAGAALLLLLSPLVAGCVTPAPTADAPRWSGRQPATPATPKKLRTGTRLTRATDVLLLAIERETGERPAVARREAHEPAAVPEPGRVRDARARHRAWTGQRAALAQEILRAVDTGDATVQTLRRARDALRWDLLVGARWSEVDRTLVREALARADAALPAPEPAAAVLALSWPVEPVHVTSRFGLRSDPFGDATRPHAGIDLAAVEGQTVRVAAAGEVLFAGERGGYGLHVEVGHADGFVSRYAHLSELLVRAGQPVAEGGLVGLAGRTGRATGPHLHFELWRDGMPVDPLDELPPIDRMLSSRP